MIVLLTRDLRLYDQPALAAACRNRNQVIPLFVHDPALLNRSTAVATSDCHFWLPRWTICAAR